MKVFLKKEIIESDQITDKGILVYAILRNLYNQNNPILLYSHNLIQYYISNKVCDNQKQINIINDGLNELIDMGLVSITYEDRYAKLINISDLYFNNNDEYFIVTDLDNIKLVYSLGKSKLLRYYLVVLGTININTKAGSVSIDLLSKMSLISKKSALNYNKILEDNSLLYICRTDERITHRDGGIKQVSNVYGRFEDRGNVENVASEYRKNINSKSNRLLGKSGNEKRSIKMMYNNFVKGSKKWKNASVDEINELIEECKRYNECFVGKNNKKLDLSVFGIEDNNGIKDSGNSVKNKNNSNNSYNDECWGEDTFN